jgi:Sec7-like guanine-nucleotide exchange factor
MVLEQAFEGIRLCADLSALFDLSDMFDVILPMLSSGTGLVDGLVNNDNQLQVNVRRRGICVTEVDNAESTEKTRIERVVPVTQLSIKFGRDYKAQLMTIQFFRTVCRHGNRFRDDGWMMVSS